MTRPPTPRFGESRVHVFDADEERDDVWARFTYDERANPNIDTTPRSFFD